MFLNHGRSPARKVIAPKMQRCDSDPSLSEPKVHSLPIPQVASPMEFGLGSERRGRWENNSLTKLKVGIIFQRALTAEWLFQTWSLQTLILLSNCSSAPNGALLIKMRLLRAGEKCSQGPSFNSRIRFPSYVIVLLPLYISLFNFLSPYTLGENKSHKKEFQGQATLQLGLFRRQL